MINFKSFLMGGFECAAPITKNGRINQLFETKHIENIHKDYQLLKSIGVYTVREGLQWSVINYKENKYDFLLFEKILKAGKKHGMQQIWDLNHFDHPDFVDPLSPDFVSAYSSYALEALNFLRTEINDTLYIVPFNEISFYAYMTGETGSWAPFQKNPKNNLKKIYAQAAISAMEKVNNIDKNVVFIHPEPVLYRPPKKGASKKIVTFSKQLAKTTHEGWEILAGNLYPELGGKQEYMQVLGVNHYYDNQQWISGSDHTDKKTFETMPLNSPQRKPLYDLLKPFYDKYKCPILITETGSYGELRVPFWKYILSETKTAIDKGLPIIGICAYPIIDRPDWDDGHLTNSGFWDFQVGDKKLKRIPFKPVLKVLEKAKPEGFII